MSDFKHSIVLFCGEDGLPLEFNVRNTVEKDHLKALIEYGGGFVSQNENAVHLISPGTSVLNADMGKKLVSTSYIYDCVKENYLLDVDEYVFVVSEAQTSDLSDEDSERMLAMRHSTGKSPQKSPVKPMNIAMSPIKSVGKTNETGSTTSSNLSLQTSNTGLPQVSTSSSTNSESFIEGTQEASSVFKITSHVFNDKEMGENNKSPKIVKSADKLGGWEISDFQSQSLVSPAKSSHTEKEMSLCSPLPSKMFDNSSSSSSVVTKSPMKSNLKIDLLKKLTILEKNKSNVDNQNNKCTDKSSGWEIKDFQSQSLVSPVKSSHIEKKMDLCSPLPDNNSSSNSSVVKKSPIKSNLIIELLKKFPTFDKKTFEVDNQNHKCAEEDFVLKPQLLSPKNKNSLAKSPLKISSMELDESIMNSKTDVSFKLSPFKSPLKVTDDNTKGLPENVLINVDNSINIKFSNVKEGLLMHLPDHPIQLSISPAKAGDVDQINSSVKRNLLNDFAVSPSKRNVPAVSPSKRNVPAVSPSKRNVPAVSPSKRNVQAGSPSKRNVQAGSCISPHKRILQLTSVTSPTQPCVTSSQPQDDELDDFDKVLLSKAQKKTEIEAEEEDSLSQSYTVSSSADAQVASLPGSSEVNPPIGNNSAPLPDSPSLNSTQVNIETYKKNLVEEVQTILKKGGLLSISEKATLVKYICVSRHLSPREALESLFTDSLDL